jgi:predicted nuclease of predicted toxin-antitoxin system
MKLLIDQNLSPKLVARLADLFPGSAHVQSLSLDKATDDDIWDYAKSNDFVIVTKDEDYDYLSVLRGTPPKVIWIQLGNCTTAAMESAFRSRASELATFQADPNVAVLLLG